MSGLDLNTAQAVTTREDEGVVVHVRGVDGERLFFGEPESLQPVTVRIAGEYSQRALRFDEAERRKLTRQLNRGGVDDDSDFLQDNIRKLAHCTLEWSGFHRGGSPIACTGDNATLVFASLPWVYAQVNKAHRDHSSFFANGSSA